MLWILIKVQYSISSISVCFWRVSQNMLCFFRHIVIFRIFATYQGRLAKISLEVAASRPDCLLTKLFLRDGLTTFGRRRADKVGQQWHLAGTMC